MEIAQFELTMKRYAAMFRVSEDLLFDVDAAVQQDFFGFSVAQFRTKILTDELPPERFTARERIAFEVPASTWQAWKAWHGHRWYARWIADRWPVRYALDPHARGAYAVCTFDLARYRTYPQARVALPPSQFGPVVYRHAITGLRWDDNPQEDERG